MKSEQLHELTVAEIARLTGEYERRRREATQALAGIFSAAAAGQPEERPTTNRTAEARLRALDLLNGYAPAGMRVPPASRKAELEIEISAIDIVLTVLSQKELVATAFEAAEFATAHGQEWEALCRDIILTATRLGALEARAVAWRAKLAGAVPSTLPMAVHIGTGRSILGIAWGADPLSRPREAALAAGIVTAKELKAAENA